MKSEKQIQQYYIQILPSLDERGRREWAASEAMALGYGGIALAHASSLVAAVNVPVSGDFENGFGDDPKG